MGKQGYVSGLLFLRKRTPKRRHKPLFAFPIPKWVYATFGIVLAAAIGFGIGFFYQMNQNSHLKEVEWQYRRMRTMYSTDADKQYLVNREKEFFTGSFHVQDSIKTNIRYWEKKSGVDKTFTYYAPTED